MSHGHFVWPSNGIAPDMPVWGHRSGLRIGLAPTRGPRGLIRIYAPYLGQVFPRVVNFLSIEPSVVGEKGRGQSELEMSRERPGERGLTFWASDDLEQGIQPESPVAGDLIDNSQTLRIYIHTEPFRNGACPVIECRFHKDTPFELELITHIDARSTPLASCTISATMGNYGQLRRIHLKNDCVISALDLWNDESPGKLAFYSWRSWPAEDLERTADGRYYVQLSSDAADPAAEEYDANVAPHWRYVGKRAIHFWRTEADADPRVAVNGRKTYWMSDSRIPGGMAFENFELRMPFQPGRKLWFGVRPD
ncbi:MAG: hypothetical protein ACQESR_04475 [Planctomycetota bacterium]